MPLQRIEKTSVLVVEGNDDERFFKALARHLKIEEQIQVVNLNGIGNLQVELKALQKVSGFDKVRTLGIALDADRDAARIFRRIQGALRAADFACPQAPLELAYEGSSPSVLVFILPGNTVDAGMLEDLCLRAVAQDPAMECVNRYFQCLQQRLDELPRNMSKAKVQVFLASRERVYLRVGEAADRGYWPWDDQVFDEAKQFLNLLAN